MITRLVIILCLTLPLAWPKPVAGSESPLIAAASGMQFALKEIARAFAAATGIEIRLTLAASGKLFRQIEHNAPFELFISADPALTQRLLDAGLTRGNAVDIGRGRLAVIAADPARLRPDARLDGLRSALAAGRVSKFAIASPQHAPYGRRAREALEAAGLWPQLEDMLVVGENVAQAAQFALSGAAQGGIVALSLLLPDKTVNAANYAVLPEAWHRPLVHSMVLLKSSDQTTMKFFQYLKSPAAQQILSRYGYTPGP